MKISAIIPSVRVSLACFKVPEENSFGHVLAQEREDLVYLACLVGSESPSWQDHI